MSEFGYMIFCVIFVLFMVGLVGVLHLARSLKDQTNKVLLGATLWYIVERLRK